MSDLRGTSFPKPVHNQATLNGDCLECGAARRQIDDGFVPICEPVTGPHRSAIIAIKRTLVDMRSQEKAERYQLLQLEEGVIRAHQNLRKCQAEVAALEKSLAEMLTINAEKGTQI